MVKTRLKVGGYEAWVVVEDQKVEHYEIEVDEEMKVATCWIASTTGKHFGVWVLQRHSRFDCETDVYLDGSMMGGEIIFNYEKEPVLTEHVHVGENSVRQFLFGGLNLTEDESILSTQSYEDLGTIEVVIHRITNFKFRATSGRPSVEKGIRVPESVKIHERAKKSATHQVLYGEMKTIVKKPARRITYTCKEVVATFIFHYRSLDMLRANEIAPCDPATEVSVPASSGSIPRKRKARVKEEEEEKNVVAISDPEDEEDKRKEAQLEAELERIRQARLDRQAKHATKKVKCEQKPVFLPGEIIDLTI